MTTGATKALLFDGESSFAALASARSLGLVESDFTVEAWIRVDAWGDTDYLPILGTAATAGQQGLHLAIKGKKPYMGFYQSDTAGQTEIATGIWYHLAWRYQHASGQQTIYVNGILDATSDGNAAFTGDESLFVGRYAAQHFFGGEIADLRLWRSARSGAEILGHMHRRLAGDEPHLAGYWPLNDGAGATAASGKAPRIGYSHDAPAAALPQPLASRGPRVLTFERDYLRLWIETPDRDCTHELWFRTTDPNAGLLACGRSNTTTTDRDLYLYDGQLTAYLWGGSKLRTSGLDLADGEWHHVAHVFGPAVSGRFVYVDGVLHENESRNYSSWGRHDWVAVGQSNRAGNKIFSGQIAEARIWDRALSQTEIRAGMHLAMSGAEPGLLACLPLDEGANERVRSVDRAARYGGNVSGDVTRVDDDDCPFDDHKALAFGGTGSKIEIPSFPGVGRVHPPGSRDEGFTLELWMRCDVPDMDQFLLTYRKGSNEAEVRWRIYNQGKNFYFHIKNSGWAKATETSFNDDAWHHLAVTWRRSGGALTLYKDGEVVAEGTHQSGASIGLGGMLSIGGYVNSSGSYSDSHQYTGRMTELRMWDTVRSAEEIAGTAGRRLSGHEPCLLGYWPLNDLGAGEDLAENRARPYVDYYGAPFWQEAPGEVAPPPVDRRRTLGLEGTGPLLLPVDTDQRFDAYTLEAWVYAEQWPAETAALIEQRDDELAVGMLLLTPDGALQHRFLDAEGRLGGPADTVAGTLPLRRWTHLAVSHDGGTVRTFVDGEALSTAPALACQSFAFGFAAGVGFRGRLAELRVWSRALGEEELAEGRHCRRCGNEEGLVGAWPLDDPAFEEPLAGQSLDRAAARGRDSHHATAAGALRAAPYLPFTDGTTFALDGTGGFLELPHLADVHFVESDQNFTLEIWVQAARQQAGGEETERVVVEKWAGGGGFPYSLRFLPASGRFVFARSDGTTPHPRVLSTLAFRDGVFHHLAAVKEGGSLKLYVDGELQGEADDNVAGTIRGTSPLYVGARAGGSHLLTGAVTELRLWRAARTPLEIWSGRRRRLSGDEPDLAGYWPLDGGAAAAQAEGTEGEAPKIIDSNEVRDGRARPAGVLSETSWSAASDLPLAGAGVDERLRVAPALAVDGQRGDVTVADSAGLTATDAITVEAWVRPDATGGAVFEGPAVSLCDSVSGWELRATDQAYAFLLTVDGEQHEASWSPPAGGAERWVHLAGIYDGSRLQLRINGIAPAAAGKDVTGDVRPHAGALTLGGSAYRPGRKLSGQLAEVRVWSTARSGAELHAGLFRRLSGSTSSPPSTAEQAGLVGYWPLSEGQGDTVADHSGADRTGTGESLRWAAAALPPRLPPGEVVETDVGYWITRLEMLIHDRKDELRKTIRRRRYREGRKEMRQEQLAEAEAAWGSERQRLETTYEGQVAAREREIEALRATQRAADSAEVDALLDDIVTKTHDQIERARDDLDQRQGVYRLGRVSMNLRYVAGAGGRGAIFPGVDTPVAGERVTKLHLDFAPSQGASPPAEELPNRVPDVGGYTATMAQRKLSEAGFLAETHAQAVPGEPANVGRVVSQLPAGDAEVAPGATVRVFVGKAS